MLSGRTSSADTKGKNLSISTNDRVSVFLELAEGHRLLSEQVRCQHYKLCCL